MADTETRPLYDYQTNYGVVLPETNAVRDRIVELFMERFGSGFDTTPETAAGRIIEALTMVGKDAICIAALNANGFNPRQAVGSYLDAIGAIFGVGRKTDSATNLPESDAKYREAILSSQSRGSGYAESIMNEIRKVDGVVSVCVLENGLGDPAVLPNGSGDARSVAVDPHSVLVCVGLALAEGMREDNVLAAIALAIFRTKAVGCGYHDAADGSYGRRIDRRITANDDGGDDAVWDVSLPVGTSVPVVFYEAVKLRFAIHATIRDDVYTGIDVEDDARSAISAYVRAHNINFEIVEGDVSSAVAAYGTGVVATAVRFWQIDGNGVRTEVPSMVMRPYEFAEVADEDITFDVV